MNQNDGGLDGDALIPYEPKPVITIIPTTIFSEPAPALASTLMVSPFWKSEKEIGYKSHDAELPDRPPAVADSTKGDALNIATRRV